MMCGGLLRLGAAAGDVAVATTFGGGFMAAFSDGPAKGEIGAMPWDSVDKRRDEDATDRRKRSRRRFRFGGRRAIDAPQQRERRDRDRLDAEGERSTPS